MRKRLAGGLAAVAMVATVAACGDDDGGAQPGTTAPQGCSVDLGIPELGTPATSPAPSTVDPMTSGHAAVAVDGGPLIPYDSEASEDLAVGCPAPGLTGVSYDSEPAAFTPGEGGPALLVFLAHWCSHCNREVPMMLEWDDAGSAPDNLNIIGISTAVSPDRPNFPPGEWIESVRWPWPVIADSEPPAGLANTLLGAAGITYGATSFPFMTLVDANGNVVARHAGELNPDQLSEFVGQVE